MGLEGGAPQDRKPRAHGMIAVLTAAEPNSLWLVHTRKAALGIGISAACIVYWCSYLQLIT